MHQTITLVAAMAVFLLTGFDVTAAEPGWGNLTGTLVLKGQPPELPKLDPGNDPFCCNANPKNESLLIGEDGGIANVIVYLRPPRGERVLVHTDYQKASDEPVEFDNKGCAFLPHVALVQTGQPLLLKNTDSVNHSIKGELGDEAFNFMLSAGGTQELSLKTAQRLPRPVSCSIHPFMRGWLLVRDNPYMTVTDSEGKFVLANLPAGEHEIQFWHERPGYLKNCQSDAAELDRRGRVTITIDDGETTDLATIVVDAALMAGEDD